MNTRTHTLHIFFCFTIALIFCVAGCQNTEAPVKQDTTQETTTPTKTDQDSATLGAQLYFILPNGSGSGSRTTPLPDVDIDDGIDDLIAKANGQTANAEGIAGRFAQAGFSWTINIGATSPSQAGTTTGSGNAAQTPTANPTVNPVQENTASVPIGVALPGGMVDQQSLATGRGQTSDTEKKSENDLRWAKIEARMDKLDRILPLLEKVFDVPAPPPTQPVSTDGTGS